MKKLQKMLNLTLQEWNWVLYDIGNSAFILLVTAIVPIYFGSLTSAAGLTEDQRFAYWGYGLSIATIVVALIGPICGTLADHRGFKKPLFTACMALGAVGCAALGAAWSWLSFLAIFVVAKIGFSSSLVFYDAMLPEITTEERMDNVSSMGYALGYIGSVIPFVVCLVIVLNAQGFGLTTGMATTYGSSLGLDSTGLLLALLVTQIVAFPCSILFGKLSNRYDTALLIKICIVCYAGIALFGVFLQSLWQFWVLAVVVGMFQGGIQALSRSYLGKIIPAERSGEYFGLMDIFGKGADAMGPALVALTTDLMGNHTVHFFGAELKGQNVGVGCLVVLFAIGFVLLTKADRLNKERRTAKV